MKSEARWRAQSAFLASEYWNWGEEDCTGLIDNLGPLYGQIDLLEQQHAPYVAAIERRLGAPSLKKRRWYRVTEIVEHSLGADPRPEDGTRLLKSFVRALEAGIFDGGSRERSQVAL